RHAHLCSFRKSDNAGNVSCTEVELRSVVVEERSMTATLVLGQNVYLSGKLGVAGNAARLNDNLTSFDLGSLNTTKQSSDVVTSLSLVKQLTEHLDTSYNSLTSLFLDTNDLNFLVQMQNTTLYTACSNSTTSGNGEYVLNRHQERLIGCTLRVRNPAVNSVHQLHDLVAPLAGRVLKSLQSGTLDDRCVISRELILVQQLTDLHVYQLKQL